MGIAASVAINAVAAEAVDLGLFSVLTMGAILDRDSMVPPTRRHTLIMHRYVQRIHRASLGAASPAPRSAQPLAGGCGRL